MAIHHPLYRDKRFWLPLLLFALFTPWSGSLDLAIETFFYRLVDGGSFSQHPFFAFIYRWGPWPSLLLGFSSLAVLFISVATGCWKGIRAPTALFAGTLLIGALLLVHLVLKDHWGRPRPKQIEQFGGAQHFRPYYEPNFSHQPEPSKSFSCGHCTAGFVFFSIGLIGDRLGRRKLKYGGYFLAWTMGTRLGLTRMAQGGHFLSDVIASGLIMWETALWLDLALAPLYTPSSSGSGS